MNCDQETTMAMIACILVVAYLNVLDKNIPQIEYLFSNDMNLLLLCILVALVVVVNTPMGVMLLIVVGYVKYYFDEKKRKRSMERSAFEEFSDLAMGASDVDMFKETHVDPDANVAMSNKVSSEHNTEVHRLHNNCSIGQELVEKKYSLEEKLGEANIKIKEQERTI